MRAFFFLSIVYAGFAAALAYLVEGPGSLSIGAGGGLVASTAKGYAPLALGAFCISIIAGRLLGRSDMRRCAIRIALAAGGSVLFFPAFSTIKRLLPEIVPFWADPAFAAMDRALHGGLDPWVLTHAIHIPGDVVQMIYLNLWSAPAFLFPLFAAIDPDRNRAARAMILFVVAWAFLGNLVAVVFMSAGPVFHDRLLGADDFAALNRAIAADPLLAAGVGVTQEALWAFYAEGRNALGSGISAFPSVHVATVTAIALYLVDIRRGFMPVAVVLVALFQFLSVYSGWHYAVDGYASVLVLVSLWVWLRRRHGSVAPKVAQPA